MPHRRARNRMSIDAGKRWHNVFGRGSEVGSYPDQLVFKPSNPDFMIMTYIRCLLRGLMTNR